MRMLKAACSIALENHTRVLILTGKLDHASGLPKSVAGHGGGLALRMITPHMHGIPTALFEVLDEDALCAIIDELQSSGGYKAVVIDSNGRSDPAYVL